MTPSTIWKVEDLPPKALHYGIEPQEPLVRRFRPVRPQMINLDPGSITASKDPLSATPPPPWENPRGAIIDASSYGSATIQMDAGKDHMLPGYDWPNPGTLWQAELRKRDLIRLAHEITDTSQSSATVLNSTATDLIISGIPSQHNYDFIPGYEETSYQGHTLGFSLPNSVTVVFISHRITESIPSQTINALERIKNLPDNWDGDGATRIDPGTVEKAKQLIRQAFLAAPGRLKPPSVAPAFDGMIVAEWSGPDGRELILDIPAGDQFPGFLLVERSPQGEEIETDDELIPPWSVPRLIARLMGN